VFYLRKTFGLVKEKRNPKGKKNSDAIKNEKKIHQIVVSHHILTQALHTIYTPTHTKKTSSLIIINVINQSINQQNPKKLSIFFSHRTQF